MPGGESWPARGLYWGRGGFACGSEGVVCFCWDCVSLWASLLVGLFGKSPPSSLDLPSTAPRSLGRRKGGRNISGLILLMLRTLQRPGPGWGRQGAQLENRPVNHQHLSGTFQVPGSIPSTLSLCTLTHPTLPQPYKEGTVIAPISQMRRLRHSVTTRLACAYAVFCCVYCTLFATFVKEK